MHIWKQSSTTMNMAARNTAAHAKLALQSKRCEIQSLETRRLMTGTWTALSSLLPSVSGVQGAQSAVVLTDGSIMVHPISSSGTYSATSFKLTPAANGSYVSGSWSTLASMNVGRLYPTTDMLQSGKVLVVGGEYSSAGNFTNTGEIYDPIANTWTSIPNFPGPGAQFGDDPSALLPNGTVLAGDIQSSATYIYNPTTNAWTQTGSKLRGDASDEEGWVTLPDHSILSYDVFSSINSGVAHSQRYIPSTGTWVDAGILPAQLSAPSVGYELGPGLMLPDGRVFFGGGVDATAFYNPSTNTWTAGPAFPNGYCMADAPGAVLPNGNLLLALSPQGSIVGGGYNFPSPTYIYELNPTTNVFTNVTPSLSSFYLGNGSYTMTFLVLPTGQVLAMDDSRQLAIYTEDSTTSPVPSAVPVITGISYSGTNGVYTLSGTNLNGINDGATYGDDDQMASNYPLVRLTDQSGVVTYARTTNWSLTGVSQGAETVTFTLPATDTTGAYLIQSVANGVPSATALAVLVNANTTTNVTIQADANPAYVDVLGGASIKAIYLVANFKSIYFTGDNAGDTLTINLNNSTGITAFVQAGSGTDTINVNQTPTNGPVVINPSVGTDAVNVGTTGAAAAVAQFLAAQQLGVLTIGNGGIATFTNTGTKKLLQTNSVVTSGTGLLDLTNNDMIVHGGDIGTLNSEIASGFNGSGGGVWTGPGITSSTAAANPTHLTALGIILNNNNGNLIYGAGTAIGTFDGQSPSPGDVLIKYTYYGDANLSGHVDGTDFGNTDNGFLLQLTGWFNGDFNYDGVVNGSDYTLIDDAFNTQGATIAAQVAQPSAIVTKATGNFAVFVPHYQDAGFTSDPKKLKAVSQFLATTDPLPTGA